jgi:hypothetical protein
MPKTLLTLMLTAVVYTLSTAAASAASPDAWTAAGPTATNSGEVMQYAVAGRTGTWTMQAKAGVARALSVNWNYKGYHAWFGVKVAIERFVIRGGAQMTETLQSASAARCCTAPSGGFNYQGTTRFDVQKDDVYGFRMTGSNADSDARLLGTLTLGVTDLTLGNDGGFGGGGGGGGMGGAIFGHG